MKRMLHRRRHPVPGELSCAISEVGVTGWHSGVKGTSVGLRNVETKANGRSEWGMRSRQARLRALWMYPGLGID